MSLVAFAFAAALAAPAPPDGAACDGNTIQIDQCLADGLARVEAEHRRYLDAARARLRKDAADNPGDPGVARAMRGFDASEAAWLAYRDAECGAVFDNWSGGTIRSAMQIGCRARLTRLRTHTLWENWLTYMDRTPPVLPEPAMPKGR